MGFVSSCAHRHNAVVPNGSFQFVSPHGQTAIAYDPPSNRQLLSPLSGQSLMDPGKTIGIADFPGDIVVINVWGQWCGPCRGEASILARTAQQFFNRHVRFLGIDFRDNADSARDFIKDRHITYPSIYDPAGTSLIALQGIPTSVIPVTIVLDTHHRVSQVFLRTVSGQDLRDVLTKLLTEDN